MIRITEPGIFGPTVTLIPQQQLNAKPSEFLHDTCSVYLERETPAGRYIFQPCFGPLVIEYVEGEVA